MATTTTISNDVTRIFDKYEAGTYGTTLTSADSGKVFKLSGSGGTIYIPEPKEGLRLRFVTSGVLDTATTRLATPAAGNNKVEGSVIVAGAVVDADAGSNINFIHTSSNIGDFVELWSDGTSYFIFGNALSSGAITITG